MRTLHTLCIAIIILLWSGSLYAQSNPSEILKQYDTFLPRISQKTPLTRTFSPDEQWILAQAFYLLGDFEQVKPLLPPLLRHATIKHQAQLLQLTIASQEQDRNLRSLLTNAQRGNLLPATLTTETLPAWLAQQSPNQQHFTKEFDKIKRNPSALEQAREQFPAFHPHRVAIERQLASLYTQQGNKNALFNLGQSASLREDRLTFRYNLASLYADDAQQQTIMLQEIAQDRSEALRIRANFSLYLQALAQNHSANQVRYRDALLNDLPNNTIYHLFIQLQESFQQANYPKSISDANRLINHRAFADLPKSAQLYAYEIRAFSRTRQADTRAALTDYTLLTEQSPQRFRWQYAQRILQPSLKMIAPAELDLLQDLAYRADEQKRILFLFIYHAYLQGDIPKMELLLAQTQTIWKKDPLYLLLQATHQRYLHHYQEAAEFFHLAGKALDAHPSQQALALMHSATNYAQAEKMLEANFQLSALLKLDSKHLEAIDVKFLLAQTLLSQNQTIKALDLFEESYQLSLKPTRQIPFLLEIPPQKEIFLQYYFALQAISEERASQFFADITTKAPKIAQEISDHYAQDLFNQGKYREFALLLNATRPLAPASRQADLLYQHALAYELSQQMAKAKALYIEHLSLYPNDPRTLAIARRLASLSTYQELQRMLFPPTTNNQPTLPLTETTTPIFVIAWVEKSPTNVQAKNYQWLADAYFDLAPPLERTQRLRLLARFYQRQNDLPRALTHWQELLNQTKQPEDHQEARVARSRIYESQGQLAPAVQELIILANTLKPWPQEAFNALQLAYDFCITHQLTPQAELIMQRMRTDYPQFL
ncbi:hypothetical protein [Entomospira culicis]|uniref:Tetratricopeptide repeat protein n=1 Tax=Entomospira culicis TaxID=2719989 RepID=A0A968GGX0_9SPIO|nr:hypothetical protein [Entomospira culicis]NIZ19479.1 hypothetical protein [Entomospira culicis]NIZ69616.1 hypothetical protein [Entomospira culicis]WDI36727.1 hypothetical protein PVA46_05220 [Entomospira culicis]WDI38356.1 hypothetical protein PVA47_05230 [Entomospira culicis]